MKTVNLAQLRSMLENSLLEKKEDEPARAEDYLIVTGHPELVEVVRRLNLTPDNTRWIGNATEDDVRGKHVIGVIPLRLAALAASVTEVPFNQQLKSFGEPNRYVVRKV